MINQIIDLIFCETPGFVSEYRIDCSLFWTCHHSAFAKVNAKIPLSADSNREVWDCKKANDDGI